MKGVFLALSLVLFGQISFASNKTSPTPLFLQFEENFENAKVIRDLDSHVGIYIGSCSEAWEDSVDGVISAKDSKYVLTWAYTEPFSKIPTLLPGTVVVAKRSGQIHSEEKVKEMLASGEFFYLLYHFNKYTFLESKSVSDGFLVEVPKKGLHQARYHLNFRKVEHVFEKFRENPDGSLISRFEAKPKLKKHSMILIRYCSWFRKIHTCQEMSSKYRSPQDQECLKSK